ncbi:MAG: hypothetical protein E3J87_10340 [Candidatus Cloacimonadota bacterium]|nr:MAG: hypothetical protein E3J87_10340 [Candidatus Cloacimonadota bacterium]
MKKDKYVGVLMVIHVILLGIILVISCSKKKSTEPEEPSGGEIIWEKLYGGSELDEGYSVKQTSDGGFIIAGYTYSFGNGESDVYVIKTDSEGNELWTQTYGGGLEDEGYSIAITSDGGYIIAGRAESFGNGYSDVYVLRLDSNGDTVWTRVYGTVAIDWGSSVTLTDDGGFIISGALSSYNHRDLYLLKFDANGDTIWSRTYHYSGYEEGTSIQQVEDGGYIVSGYASIPGTGDHDIYLLRTDENGDSLWTKTFGGSEWDEGHEVIQTTDGGFIIIGEWESNDNTDVCLIKVDGSGNEIWTKTYGGSEGDYGYSVRQTADGGYILAARTFSFGEGNGDIYIIKTDANGDTIWTQTYGGDSYDNAFSICETSDAKYVVVGYNGSKGAGSYDVWFLKIEP